MQRSLLARLTTSVAVLALVLGACSSPPGGSGAPSAPAASGAAPSGSAAGGAKGTVKIAINPWVGAEANVAVVKSLLEDKLGYTVTATPLAEEVAWPGFETGEIDVILENWGHPDLEKKYITDTGVAQDAGLNGVDGIIGWYVPEWMATQYPDIVDSENLNKYAELFKTSESGEQGQFLGSDPTFVTNDEALIKNLDLNFKVVYSGSEAAHDHGIPAGHRPEDAAARLLLRPAVAPQQDQAGQGQPAGLDRGLRRRARTTVACDYPLYKLNKIVATTFADSGGDAATLVKNFSWTNEDQNLVADYITNQGMSADDAGDKWVADNEAKWSAWMP